MANIKELLKTSKNATALSVLKAAGTLTQREDMEGYVVGGFVRDILMGNSVNDVDIMVIGDGILFAKKLAKELGVNKTIPFEKFGTARIPYNKIQIEVSSARMEDYEAVSRKPSKIEYTDLKGDLERRDFTVNAMAIDIHPDRFGDLEDPYSGVRDLEKKILKTPLNSNETFSEDPLRVMRAAYFAAKLGFKLDNECRKAMREQAHRISIVSSERVRDEFIKILQTDRPSIGLVILQKIGLMKIIFPEIHRMYGMEQSPEWHHKDIFAHTLQVVDNAAKLSTKMELRFAALVHDIAKPNTRRIDKRKGYTFHGHDAVGEKMLDKVSRRMKLSNKLKNYIKKLTLLHLRPIALVKDVVTDSAVRRLMVAAGDDLEDLMLLCRADITTKNPRKVEKYMKNFAKVEQKMDNVIKKDSMKKFQSPVRGNEIMSVCGISEGKVVGRIKNAIEEAIIEGKIDNNHEDALKYLENIKNEYVNV